MKDLEKIFGSERFETISKLNITPSKVTIFNSIIFKKDGNDNNPIYLTHSNLPELIDDESELISPLVLEVVDDSYITGDYFWNPIDYTDIIFSDLNPNEILNDIILITENDVFELTNVYLDADEGRLFYAEAIQLNN